tara:strand:- start:4489 stop:5178 length:690 start_codon:yes stop_codon:yes gene_type:complete
MGFLQQDTNNIILDAVLTKEGRRRLAANNGSFQITHFSLGDDEVDYSVIKKYGRAVGREKIEKNTPVFEALTDGNLESLSRLITISDSTVSALATYTLSVASVDLRNVIGSNPSSVVTITQAGANDTAIPPEIQDTVLSVSMDRRFTTLRSVTPFQTVGNVDYYNVTANSTEGNESVFSITIVAKALVTNSFTVFGSDSNSTKITTVVRLQGRQSGMTNNIPVVLNKNA